MSAVHQDLNAKWLEWIELFDDLRQSEGIKRASLAPPFFSAPAKLQPSVL